MLRLLVEPPQSYMPPDLDAAADGPSRWIRQAYAARPELVERALRIIGENLGRFALVWPAAHSALEGLTRLRHRLEAECSLRENCHQALCQQAEQVYRRIEQQQEVPAMDAEGGELSDWINVSFWTGGDYAHLTEQACQALAVVNGMPPLESQGFYLEEAAYQQDDFRGTFVARTRSLSGSEVMVSIDPDPGLEEGGHLHIRSGDARLVTEHELLRRNREIFQAIQAHGVQVSPEPTPESPPETPAQRLRAAQLKKRTHADPRATHGSA